MLRYNKHDKHLFFLTTLNILIKPQIGFKSAIQIYIYLLFSGLITQI